MSLFSFFKRKEPKPPVVEKKVPMRKGTGNPGTFDAIENELEKSFIAFREREISVQQFLEVLLNSKAYVLVPEGQFSVTEDGTPSLKEDPHIFCITNPEYVTLCVYTSNKRCNPTIDKYPEFRYAVQTQVGDLIMGIQNKIGLVINPYWDVNTEWTPDQVQSIKEMFNKG